MPDKDVPFTLSIRQKDGKRFIEIGGYSKSGSNAGKSMNFKNSIEEILDEKGYIYTDSDTSEIFGAKHHCNLNKIYLDNAASEVEIKNAIIANKKIDPKGNLYKWTD